MSFKKCLLSLIVIIFCFGIKAQSLYQGKFNGPYLLLYKLNAEQTIYLLKNPTKIDTQFLYTTLVGKVSSDSAIPLYRRPADNYPIQPFTNKDKYNKCSPLFHIWDIQENGYFIEVTVTNNYNVSYRLIENSLFNASVYKIGYETFVFVEDTAGIPVYNATVTIDTVKCNFDSSMGGYKVNNVSHSGYLKIERNGIFSILNTSFIAPKNNQQIPKDNYKYDKIKYQGYLVTNKPKYKYWDTIFFKSFLVNKRGKPINEELIIRLYQPAYTHAKEIEIKPKYKGDYNGFFILDDSFILDKTATISLLNSKRNIIKSQDIYIENYDLKDVYFELKSDKTLVTPGEGIKFFAIAKNANGLPIMDGKIKLLLSNFFISYTDKDSVVIPFSKLNNWHSVTLQTDPSGVTEIEIHDSIFMALDGNFNAKCILQTSDNETKEVSVNFKYQTTRDRQFANLDKDTLSVFRFFNMQMARRKMRIKTFSRTDLLTDTVFQTPFKAYISPNIYMVQIFQGDTLTGTFYRQTQLPEIKGVRTHDSIKISFYSEKDIPVFYRIYANNKLVHSGSTTQLNWEKRDTKKQSYHLQYGILEGSVTQPRFYSQSFHLAEKQLKVSINQPKIIYPGQLVPVEITVTDAYGKPVNNVNLSAWAVNTQMQDIVTPDVPYLGLNKIQRPLPMQQLTVSKPYFMLNKNLQEWQIQGFYLYENPIYHLLYPKKGFEILRDTTPNHSTEIEFFVHKQYARQKIAWATLNDTLILLDNSSNQPEVLRVLPGTHKIKIRTFSNIYTFDSVVIVKGMKNFICLHTDSLDKLQKGVDTIPGQLSNDELDFIYNHTLLFRYDYLVNDTFIIAVNGNVKKATPNGNLSQFFKKIRLSKNQFNATENRKRYTTYDDFFLLPGIESGDIVEFKWKNGYSHQITFQPGNTYSFTKNDLAVDNNIDWNKEIAYFSMENTANYTLNNFWFDPYFVAKSDNIYKQQNPIVYSEPKIALQPYQYKNYNPNNGKKPYNSYIKLYIPNVYYPQRIWLFNMQDSSYSVMENWNSFTYQYHEIGMIARRDLSALGKTQETQQYKLLVQINDSMWAVKDLTIDTAVNLFLFLHPSQFRKLNIREYVLFDRLAKNLTRTELTKWADSATINQSLYIIPVKHKKGATTIEGTVTGPGIQYPIDNAFIVLELNGKFIKGAYTNYEGRFVMENLQPGLYMLKIKSANYHYYIHYSVKINTGYTHIIMAQLTPFAKYSYINSSRDFTTSTENDYYLDEANQSSPMTYYSNSTSLIESSIAARGKNKLISKSTKRAESNISLDSDKDGLSSDYEVSDEKGRFMSLNHTTSLVNRANEDDRLDGLATDINAQRVRKDFKDYAYWKPQLFTNKQGKSSFTVKFPDNSTSWKTFVPAMDGKRHSGLGEFIVNSYKPITTTVSLPNYLNENDTLLAFGKVLNYTSKSINGKFSFRVNDQRKYANITLGNYHTDSIAITANTPGDTISVETTFELENGYKDGELRKIPVYASHIEAGKSWFVELADDTSAIFRADSADMGMDIVIYNHKLALIIDILKEIESFPTYDLYTTAKYLNALLIKKSVCKALSIPFEQEKQIRETMTRLRKSQRPDGLFGWFKGSENSFVVTTEVAEAMYFAHQSGYENNTWITAAGKIEKQLPIVYGLERIEYLLCLKNLNRKLEYDSFIKEYNKTGLSKSIQLKYIRLKQLLGKNINLNELYPLIETTFEGNLKIAGTWNWKFATSTDDIANTNLGWHILFDAKKHPEKRMAMLEYLSSESQNQNLSLIYAAKMMMAEASINTELNNHLQPQIKVNGAVVPLQKMPAAFHLNPGDSIHIDQKGGPVYVAASKKYKTYFPKTDSAEFRISSQINQNKNIRLEKGEQMEMKVTVFAKRNQFNNIIEIPIPAGCVYGQKIQDENFVEIHREYLTDRVLIFCDELPFGVHTFTIKIIPKFTGVFHTAPARVSLMFYSDKAAYTTKQRWIIGQ